LATLRIRIAAISATIELCLIGGTASAGAGHQRSSRRATRRIAYACLARGATLCSSATGFTILTAEAVLRTRAEFLLFVTASFSAWAIKEAALASAGYALFPLLRAAFGAATR
jgi:hypothetical protein